MNENELKTEWATRYKQSGMSQAQMIIEHYPSCAGMLLDADLWPNIDDSQSEFAGVDIVTPKQKDWQPNILELYSDSVRQTIKFPPNTCFLHGLGSLSSAASRNFTYSAYPGNCKPSPVTLFTICGQPSGAGKSGINDCFMDPIKTAYDAINKANKVKSDAAERDKDELVKMLKSATHPAQIERIEMDLVDKAETIKSLQTLRVNVTDPTPEGVEKVLMKQDGWANIISDEMEAVNTMLGLTYGDSSKKAGNKSNNGILLAMWNGGWISVVRGGRDGYDGQVKGSFCCLAQNDTIKAILEAGSSGRGISERFLLLMESDLMGTRDHTVFIPLDNRLQARYIDMVNNVVNSAPVNLEFTKGAHYVINLYRNELEGQMGDGGIFEDNMMRGAMSKAGDQIKKIACIMWIAQEWGGNGSKRIMIGEKTTTRAIDIFRELSRTYLHSAENSGYAGLKPKLEIVMSLLAKRFAKLKKEKKQPKVTVQQLQQTLKNNKSFASTGKLTSYIRDTIMPELVANGAVILARGEYYINPRVMEIEE